MSLTNWKNLPDTSTPVNENNLNNVNSDLVNVGSSIDSNYKTNILLSDNLCNISLFGLFPNTSGTIVNYAYNNAIIDTRNITSLYVSGDYSLLADGVLRVGKYNTYPVVGSTGTRLSINTSRVIDTSDANYVLFAFSPADGKTIEQIKNSFMVNKGSTEQPYQPYIAPTINVDGEDIYVKGQNDFYSIREQRIGTWIDGKPLYRKVVEFGALPNATSKSVRAYISNISEVTKLTGIANTVAGGITIPLLSASNLSNQVTLYYDKGNDNVEITTGIDRSNITSCYIIIEYTKTTD